VPRIYEWAAPCRLRLRAATPRHSDCDFKQRHNNNNSNKQPCVHQRGTHLWRHPNPALPPPKESASYTTFPAGSQESSQASQQQFAEPPFVAVLCLDEEAYNSGAKTSVYGDVVDYFSSGVGNDTAWQQGVLHAFKQAIKRIQLPRNLGDGNNNQLQCDQSETHGEAMLLRVEGLSFNAVRVGCKPRTSRGNQNGHGSFVFPTGEVFISAGGEERFVPAGMGQHNAGEARDPLIDVRKAIDHGSCTVPMAPSLVRRETFGSRLGRRCEDSCRLHVNFPRSQRLKSSFSHCTSASRVGGRPPRREQRETMREPLARLIDRRAVLLTAACAACGPMLSLPQRAGAVEVEAKSPLIEFSKSFLPSETVEMSGGPLDAIAWNAPKRTGLNTERMCDAISDGLREREWFVTGRGLPELFSDDFRFSDPDVSLDGFEPYCRQVRRLFDQETSRCELVCSSVTAPNTISVVWRNSGKVNIGPLGIELKPYVVTTTLKTSPADGLVVSQVDEFVADGPGLLLYQVPFLRPLAGPPAPSVDILRQQCDFATCKIQA